MERIQDKIRDLVEPQAFDQVGNFAEDPARALAAYRFTDVTSDLLARWLDALAGVARGGGAALALAGARGVGKSHTLAVFGALAGSERLRESAGDPHVATSARRLSGRRCAVVRVERGTRPTLAGEVAAGFARVFGGGEGQLRGEPAEMLSVAASRAGDETLVLLVDTAFNRPARVNRDDGPTLGGLAGAARAAGAFVALALDDDIAGADGVNVALAGAYRIDYLDPENLFRVAEQFVLRKKPQGRDRVRDIYQALRSSVPYFNWSEARFASLYPVHPLVAETAPGVRLHVPGFAFLPFAAGVAARAASRPALSLVLLDEVFDANEAALRESAELRAAFDAYDALTGACVNRLPVMLRHQARLLLKSLFVLSLDGRGATAGELCAALLLTDEQAGTSATRQVEDILAGFTQESGGTALRRAADAGGQTRYLFRTQAAEESEPTAPVTRRAPPAALARNGSGGAGPVTTEAGPAKAETAGRPAGEEESLPTRVGAGQGGQASVGTRADVSGAPGAAKSIWADLAADESLWDERPAQGAAGVGGGGKDFVAGLLDELAAELDLEGAAPPWGVPVDESSSAEGVAAVPGGSPAKDPAAWARRLTGRDDLARRGSAAWHEETLEALAAWLEEWRALRLEEKFGAIPPVRLTTRLGRCEADVARSYGRAARAVEETLAGRVTPEEGLGLVADAFRNSAEVFAERERQLADFRALVEGFERRERLRAYLTHAEPTGAAEVETARRELLKIADDPNSLLDAGQRDRFENLWREFHQRYAEHYAERHDLACAGPVREKVWAVRRGAAWREFERLARLPVVGAQVWRRAEASLRRAEEAQCDLPVRELLAERPSCACRFRLAQAESLGRAAEELEQVAARGLEVCRRALLLFADHLAIGLDALARLEADGEEARRARALSNEFVQSRLPERLTRADARLIERALRRTPAPPVSVEAPCVWDEPLTREELRERLERWLEELPEHTVLVGGGRESGAGVS